MKDIAEIDKNLKVETSIEREGLVFKNVLFEPFRIYGIYHDGEKYRRMPADVAEKTNPGVATLASNTAGGRVRFITDSPYIAIKARLPHNVRFSHMALTGVSGFDMYVTEDGQDIHMKTFVPPVDFTDGYEAVCDFADGDTQRLITLNFPLYNNVHQLYIGIKEGCTLKAAPEYRYEKPIVYYGSSITQGGCASRPGNSYQGFITRRFNIDHINLGFSGNARGEQVMADYIAGLDMSLFVFDYDHNAPSNEHYEKTHEPFFKTVREKNPDIPIIIMTRPKAEMHLNKSEWARIEIARRTYENAKALGDKNVYFIPGYELMNETGGDGCVDYHHPTDYGFACMAKRLGKELEPILEKMQKI